MKKMLAFVIVLLLTSPMFTAFMEESRAITNVPMSKTYNESLIEAGYDVYSPFQVNITGRPIDGNQIEITTNVTAYRSFDHLVSQTYLPDGVEYLIGNLSWEGSLMAGSSTFLVSNIRISSPGNWTVTSAVECHESNIQRSNSVFIELEEDGTIAIRKDPSPVASTLAQPAGPSPLNMQVMEIGTTSLVIVQGKCTYLDQSWRSKSIKYAKVELWRKQWYGHSVEDTKSTNQYGEYTFTAVEGGTLAVAVYCDASAVRIATGAELTYYWWSNWFTISQDTYVQVTADNYQRGVWACYHNIIDEYQWLDNGVSWRRSKVTVHWPVNDPIWNPWPHSHGDTIDMPDSGQWQGCIWWRDVVLHEYAHCIMWAAYGNRFPSGTGPSPHYPDSESSGGFAIIEGWAEFMQCAVDNNPHGTGWGSLESTVYADGPFGHGDYGDWDGNIVEGAVAGILWDMFDGVSTTDYPSWAFSPYGDNINKEFSKLWSIILNYDPGDVEDVWTNWNPKNADIWAIYYHNRINKDTTAPSNPNSYTSSHIIRVWSSDNTIEIQWSGAWDDLSGVYGYSRVWDSAPGTIPDTTVDQTGTLSISFPLSTGTTWYLHIRATDNAGNWASGAFHVGPFYIDTDDPSVSAYYSPINPTDADSVSFTVSASDGNSGLSFVGLYWFDGVWHAQTWTLSSSTGFSAIVGVGKFSLGTIYYYATAVDMASNDGRDPSTGNKSFAVVDDDTTSPSFSNPYTTPSPIYDSHTGDITCYIDITDGSGVSEVGFRYRFSSTDWSAWGVWTGSTPAGTTQFYATILRTTWINYASQTLYFQWYAIDNDNDRTGDKSPRGESPSYSATISDDDVTGPTLSSPYSTGDIFDSNIGSYRIQISASDPSSVYTVSFRYRFGPGGWSSWRTSGGASGNTYWYDISRSEWINHVGETIYWQAYGEDNDNDRTNDRASTTSPECFGGTIYDDDTSPPSGSSPYPSDGETYYEDYPSAIRLGLTWTDTGGISNVLFYYRYTSTPPGDWYERPTSGSSGDEYWYDIPRTEWVLHVGEEIQWVSEAWDNDNDRPDDQLPNKLPDPPYTIYLREVVAPPSLVITADSPVNIRVTAPNGLQVGYDPTTGSTINEIPGATYSGPGSEPQVITIPNPIEGNYVIDAFAIATGTYIITMQSLASDGTIIDSKVWTGTAELGEQYTETLRVNTDGTISDITPPTTLHDYNGLWHSADFTITLTASDDLSGVAETYYRINDGPTKTVSTNGQPLITTEGADNKLEYWSVDMIGNEESHLVLTTIKLDKTAPIISGAPIAPPDAYGWYKTDPAVHFTASDTLSGIDYVTPDHTLTTEGADQFITGMARDIAGNVAYYTVTGINIDKTAPSISGVATTPSNAHGWYRTDVTVHFEASDALSGIDFITPDQTLSTEGADQSVVGTAIDRAGNEISYTVFAINVDKTAPLMIGAPTTSPNAYGWYNTNVLVHFGASDTLSGIDSLTPDQILTSEGADQLVLGTAVDKAGNTASYMVLGINIDKTPPTITGAATTSPNSYNWYNTDITVHFTASDSLSGLDTLTPDQTLSSEASDQSVTGTAMDRAGNGASFTVSGINIDKTVPTMSGAPTTLANPNGWYRSDVTIHFTASDALSGLDTVTPDQTLSTEGADQLVTGYASDMAGNTATFAVSGINIDKTPPSITGAPTTPANAYGWYRTDVVVHFEASDSLSGLDTLTPDPTLSSEGAGQFVTGTTVDRAGNSASLTVTDINIDKTQPNISGAPTTAPNAHGWYKSDVTIHFIASDALSGLDTLTSDQTLTAEGAAQGVTGTATDRAGNTASCVINNISIDKTPPILSGAATTLPNAHGWYKTDVVIHFEAIDSLSGMDTLTPDTTLSNEGAGQSATGTAVDNAGNEASYTVLDIDIDKTPPIISGAPTTSPNAYGWYKTDVTVHFEASDTLSGIDFLTLDQTLTTEGTGQSVVGTARDRAGNEMSHTVWGINIDKTPPIITGAAATSPNAYGWYNTDVVVHFDASDTLSGIDTITPDQTLTVEGADQSVQGTAVDNAGNMASYTVSGINIDKTPPTVSGAPTTSPNAYGWYNADVTVQFTVSDALSGVPPIQIPPPHVLTTEGAEQSVTATVADRAGNSETFTISGINIDKTPPSVSGAPTTLANAHGWYRIDVTIHFAAYDSISGIDSLTPDTILSGEGAGQSATGTAVDKAGNEASCTVTWINIDKTPPVISATPTTPPNAYGWYKTDVTVHFTASDSLSGIDFLTPDQILSDEGAGQSVTGIAIDLAGNEASYTVSGISIDKTPPIITGAPTAPANAYGWYNTDVTVHFTASDSLSGIDTVTPDQTLTGEGAGQSVIGVAIDKAGNSASYKVAHINIDKTEPVTTLTVGDPWFGADPTYVSITTEFALEASDSLSGLHHTEYKIDSGSWTVYTTPFNITSLGSHTIHYRSVDLADNMETTHSLWIIVNAASLTYTGEASAQYSDSVTLGATLIDMATQQPILGKSITFTIGSQSATSITDDTGVASTSIILDQPAGTYTVSATFIGDLDYVGSSDSESFTIQKEDATVEYTGETVVPTTAKTINLRATVFDSPDTWWGDLTKIQVTFRIYTTTLDLNSPVTVVGPIPVTQTNAPGVGVATATIEILPENGYLIIVSIDTNDYYSGPTSDPTALTVYEPTGSFVTGGGWIWDPSGSKGNFGFNVKYTKSGNPQGHSVYVYREGGWDYIVKSNAWIGLAIQGKWAYFEAKCVVQKYNPATGELVWAEGNYMFRVDTWDNDSNGGIDVYQIRVLDKNGAEYHQAAQELQGGNIVIHDERRQK